MSRYLSEEMRTSVAERANHCCEYCRLPLRYSLFRFQVDHIVSIKHGGQTILENLALSCGFCNINKGSDLGTFLDSPRHLVPFFHPRFDTWYEHFELEGAVIVAKTSVGAATVKIFRFNQVERIMERQILLDAGLYP